MRRTITIYQAERKTVAGLPIVIGDRKHYGSGVGCQLGIRLALLALNTIIWTGCQCEDWEKHLRNLPLMGPVVGTEGIEDDSPLDDCGKESALLDS